MIPGHFCGKAIDFARHCCRAGMRLWADSDEVTPGYWFRVPDTAEVISQVTCFGKRSTWLADVPDWPATGEQQSTYDDYYKGQNPVGYDGRRHCGGTRWIRAGGLHGIDEALQTEADGSLACCFRQDFAPFFTHATLHDSGLVKMVWLLGLAPGHRIWMAVFRRGYLGAVPQVFPGWTWLTSRTSSAGFGNYRGDLYTKIATGTPLTEPVPLILHNGSGRDSWAVAWSGPFTRAIVADWQLSATLLPFLRAPVLDVAGESLLRADFYSFGGGNHGVPSNRPAHADAPAAIPLGFHSAGHEVTRYNGLSPAFAVTASLPFTDGFGSLIRLVPG